MYAVVRTYKGPGADELFDLLDRRKAEVEAVTRRGNLQDRLGFLRWRGMSALSNRSLPAG